MAERHSEEIGDHNLISDPEELARAEEFNSLQQFDAGMLLLDQWLASSQQPRIRPSDILSLNRILLYGINSSAGNYRNLEIRISNSKHKPPPAEKLAYMVEEFCEYINSEWSNKSALHLSAYALWKLNWIHPFSDGNGRTARIISYIILSAKLGYVLPGVNTIPEQISQDKKLYYDALEDADEQLRLGITNIEVLESLLSDCLAAQLLSIHEEAENAENLGSEERAISAPDFLSVDPTAQRPSHVIYIASHQPPESEKSLVERNPVLFAGLFGVFAATLASIITAFFG